MSEENLQLWDSLKDPDTTLSTKTTKTYTGRGGFKGTSVDPVVRLHMLTRLWGPQGLEYDGGTAYHDNVPTGGWGFVIVDDKCIPQENPKEHVIRVRLWYPHNGKMRFVEGIGCTDIEQLDCAKKSLTDAQSNAAKQVGSMASVYLGKFEDEKYVKDMTRRQRASKAGKDPEVAQEPVTAAAVVAMMEAKSPWETVKAGYASLSKEDKAQVIDQVKRYKEESK